MIRSAVFMRKQLHRKQDGRTTTGRIRDRGKESTERRTSDLDAERAPVDSHLPLRANSIDLMAVVLLVPVVTLKEATSS